MARNSPRLLNDVRTRRLAIGWSQEELARRSGLSRPEISAIETGRLVPSTLAALALAEALECRVEHLFRREGRPETEAGWAWTPRHEPARYWRVEIQGQTRLYPAEPGPVGVIPHDGVHPGSGRPETPDPDLPRRTLLVAGCDPAAGLLALEIERRFQVRLIALPRSSAAALHLLKDGLVHVAGLHLGAGDPDANLRVVRERLGEGFGLLRLATWEEGIVHAPGLRFDTVRSALGASMRWIGRDVGSGARQCLDELLGPRRVPRRTAPDHLSVATAIRAGWADAGVCLRLVGEDAGLPFLPVRQEHYDLCFPVSLTSDPRFLALVQILRSAEYRRLLSELPGYNASTTGDRLA